jgi:MoaA/NifB/PqqE/SkfB family radical SAM enzyme
LGGRRIHLSGGEPLLYDDFVEVVRCAKGLGLFVSLTTSGFRVKERLEALRQVDQIQLSFDGPEEVRAALCGETAARAGAAAVDLLGAHGIPFWTVTVLTRLNLSYMDWVVDHARRHGLQANFAVMERHPEVWTPDRPMLPAVRELLPSDEENRSAFRRMIAMKRQGAPIGTSLPFLQEVLDWEDYSRLTRSRPSRRYRCVAWQSQCEVYAEGDLHICDWTLRHGHGVSVREHGFKGAWERMPRPEDCRACCVNCNLEANLILSLNPSAVLNWGRRLMLSRTRTRMP